MGGIEGYIERARRYSSSINQDRLESIESDDGQSLPPTNQQIGEMLGDSYRRSAEGHSRALITLSYGPEFAAGTKKLKEDLQSGRITPEELPEILYELLAGEPKE